MRHSGINHTSYVVRHTIDYKICYMYNALIVNLRSILSSAAGPNNRGEATQPTVHRRRIGTKQYC